MRKSEGKQSSYFRLKQHGNEVDVSRIIFSAVSPFDKNFVSCFKSFRLGVKTPGDRSPKGQFILNLA